MLSAATSDVLLALVDECENCPVEMKISTLALKARVHYNTASMAIVHLAHLALIVARRKKQRGLSGVYRFEITANGRVVASSLRIENGYKRLSLS